MSSHGLGVIFWDMSDLMTAASLKSPRQRGWWPQDSIPRVPAQPVAALPKYSLLPAILHCWYNLGKEFIFWVPALLAQHISIAESYELPFSLMRNNNTRHIPPGSYILHFSLFENAPWVLERVMEMSYCSLPLWLSSESLCFSNSHLFSAVLSHGYNSHPLRKDSVLMRITVVYGCK